MHLLLFDHFAMGCAHVSMFGIFWTFSKKKARYLNGDILCQHFHRYNRGIDHIASLSENILFVSMQLCLLN